MTPTTDTSREARAEAAYDAALIAEGNINVGSGFARRTALRAMLAFATAEQQRIPDGFVLVPVQPTMDMGLAGAEQVNRHMRGPGTPADYDAAMDAYRAMIAALQPHEVKP